jgi:hypothetical protein
MSAAGTKVVRVLKSALTTAARNTRKLAHTVVDPVKSAARVRAGVAIPASTVGLLGTLRNGRVTALPKASSNKYKISEDNLLKDLRKEISTAIQYKSTTYRKNALKLAGENMDPSDPLFLELKKNEADHVREPNELNQILKVISPWLDPKLLHLFRLIANNPEINFAFVPKNANIAKGSVLDIKKQVHKLAELGLSPTLENVVNYLYTNPNSRDYGKKIFIWDPLQRKFVRCETSLEAYEGVVNTRINFDNNISNNIEKAAFDINIRLDEPQLVIADIAQKMFQYQGRLTEQGNRENINLSKILNALPNSLQIKYNTQTGAIILNQYGYPVRGKQSGGGLFDTLILDPRTRQEFIDIIDDLIEIYLSDTHFTYDSFFDGTYKGENPEPTKEQQDKDAEFTLFLMNLSNKLSDQTETHILPNVMHLSRKLYKPEIHPAMREYMKQWSGKPAGGTRKRTYLKKSYKEKRYSRRK